MSNPSNASPRIIVFTLWLLVFAASSQVMIMSPILPRISVELGVPDAALGTLVSAYAVMVGVFAIVAGPISDYVGRRRILLLGTGTMAVALSLHGFATDYAGFLGARLFAGMAGGVLSGAAVSYVGDFFPYERRGWATGWVMSGSAFGQIVGIPLGILLAGRFGVKAPFFLFAAAMTLTWLLVFTRVPQPDVQRSSHPVTVRRALAGYVDLLRRPGIAWAAFAFLLMFLGLSVFVVYLPTWLERDLGVSPDFIASLFLVGGIANVLTGPQAGRLSDRIGRRAIVLGACAGLSVVMAITTWVVRAPWVAYPMFFITMVLLAARISPFSALLTALVEDGRRGSLMSLTVALGQVGFALGGALAGPLFSQAGYRSNTLLASVSVLGMGLVVWFLVPEPPRGGRVLGGSDPAQATPQSPAP